MKIDHALHIADEAATIEAAKAILFSPERVEGREGKGVEYYKNACSKESGRVQNLLAAKGMFAPIVNNGSHRYLVVGNQIIDPTFAQFFEKSSTATDGNEPFVGNYDQMVDRLAANGFADPAAMLEKEWGIVGKDEHGNLKLADHVVAFTGNEAVKPKTVEDVKRLMAEQKAMGLEPGAGLPAHLVEEAGTDTNPDTAPPSVRTPKPVATDDDAPATVRDPQTKPERPKAAHDGTPAGVDVHNHFMGVATVDDFAKAIGKGKPVDSATLLATVQTAVRNDGDMGKLYKNGELDPKKVDKKGGANLAAIASAQKGIADLRDAEGDTPEVREKIEKIARKALDAAFTASEDTPFDGAYRIRQAVVEGVIDPQIKNDPKAYKEYLAITLDALSREGIVYSEQSVGPGKLAEAFPEDVMRAALVEANKARAERGEPPMDVRFLAMVSGKIFGPGVSDLDIQKALVAVKPALARGDVMGIDFAGPETTDMTAGGEQRDKVVKEMLLALRTAGHDAGRPLVFRPHVGEGYVESTPFNRDANQDHYEKAEKNITALLDSLDAAAKDGIYDPANPDPQIRFGHVTHATAEQAKRMRELGVVAEINLGSNVASGAVNDPTKALPRDEQGRLKDFRDHSLLAVAGQGTPILLSTDGQGVMRTTLKEEYQRARTILEEFIGDRKHGATGFGTMPVTKEDYVRAGKEDTGGPYELSYKDLPPDVRANIDRAYSDMVDNAHQRHADVLDDDRRDARRAQ